MENQAFLTKWIKSHADACKKIGKPFVLEEFGKNVTAETDAQGLEESPGAHVCARIL